MISSAHLAGVRSGHLETAAWSTTGQLSPELWSTTMAGKNKGGREIRKPKQPKKAKTAETSGALGKPPEVKRPK